MCALTECECATIEWSSGVALSWHANTTASIIGSNLMNGGGPELYQKLIVVEDVDPSRRWRPMLVLGAATDEERRREAASRGL
jgi:hypothetical protein